MPLHQLQVGKRRTKQMATRGAPERFIERAASESKRSRANRGAEHIECRHRDLEAISCIANEGGTRHATAIEAKARQWMWSHDVQAFGDRQARVVRFDNESGKAARTRRLAGAGKDDVEVGDATVRNPGLLAVNNESVSITAGDSGDIRDVGARGRFG